MNETIKKLFVESGGSIRIDEVTKDEWTYTEDLNVEKFADLIIEEYCGKMKERIAELEQQINSDSSKFFKDHFSFVSVK